MLNIIQGVCLGLLRTLIKVKSILPQSSGKWLRVLIVVQQQSPRSCPIIFAAHPIEPITHPSTPADSSSGAHVGMQHISTAGGLIVGEEEEEITEKQKKQLCLKISYWVLVTWAIGQRAVRPKLQRQYTMPLESDQLSEIGSYR